MRADLSEITKQVQTVLDASDIKGEVLGFHLEEENSYGPEFIRVILDMRDSDAVPVDKLLAFSHSVQDALEPLDDRFPSVRFSDAAYARLL